MMENKNKNYDSYSKTEFLFESDAEKAVLNEAAKKQKNKIHKKIIFNAIVICTFFIGMSFSLNLYKTNEINKIMASVNVSHDYKNINEKINESSNHLQEIDDNFKNKYEIIINKANPIDEQTVNNYNLVRVENNLYNGIKLEEETYNNYLKLKENLIERGYYINIRSGFRTFNSSLNIYNNYVKNKGENYAKKYVAKPGTSEHNTGLAFDFIISTNKTAYQTNYDSDEYFYLENIAYLYGFIFRYPKDKEHITGYAYEPWHLRYVGADLAKYLKKNNLTLEEYYE